MIPERHIYILQAQVITTVYRSPINQIGNYPFSTFYDRLLMRQQQFASLIFVLGVPLPMRFIIVLTKLSQLHNRNLRVFR